MRILSSLHVGFVTVAYHDGFRTLLPCLVSGHIQKYSYRVSTPLPLRKARCAKIMFDIGAFKFFVLYFSKTV